VTVQNASELRAQADRCRRLANAISDVEARDILKRSAEEFEKEAKVHEAVDSTGAVELVHD
jgi:hypothetical protein